jgi:hypothetical protein
MAPVQQRKAVIGRTVYEQVKAQKGAPYRPLSVNGASSRRIAVTLSSTVACIKARILSEVVHDQLYELAHQDDGCIYPEDIDEYCAEDVAQIALDFVQGKVLYQY